MTALHISDRFAAWKRDSFASANHPHCITPLHIFQRFAPWNLYLWTSWNRLSCRKALQLSESFDTWICHAWQWTNRTPCSSTHFISILFTASKQNSLILAVPPTSRTALPIFERFEAWKSDFWESANRPHNRAEQDICECFKDPNTLPEYQQIEVLSWRHCPHLNVSQPEYDIPKHQQINPVEGRHYTFLNDSQPEKLVPEYQQNNFIAGPHCPYS